MRMIGVTLRLLLLAVLGISVIGMHTIGHSTDHHLWVAPPADGTSDVAGDAATAGRVMQPPFAGANPCDGDCGSHGALTMWTVPGSHQVPDVAGLMTVCLAVLVGTGLLALLSHVLARTGPVPRGSPPGTAQLRQTWFTLAPRFPLRLVDVAVLRT
jgi:hypothetical protein